MATKEYDALIDMGVRSLPAKTLWCIIDPGGEPMLDTASKRFDEPVIMFCSALKCDWDDATEVGYRLGQTTVPQVHAEH
jgi:hypothetical protein